MKQSLPLAAAVVSGAFVALQQRLNGDLGRSLHDPLLAAVVSFGSGLLLLTILLVRRPAGLSGLRGVPWWTCTGGLFGATLVTVGATAAPKVGVALLTVGFVAGSTVAALGVDRAGLGPGGARPLTAYRLVAAFLCLVAIVLTAREGTRSTSALLLAGIVLAGAGISVQQALNGRVRSVTGPLVATFLNFVVGTVALLGALLVKELSVGVRADDWPGQWHLYAGGAIGAAFIAVAAVTVRTLGVLRLGLAITAGQLTGGLLLDLDRGVAATTVAAAAVTMVAVAVSGRGAR